MQLILYNSESPNNTIGKVLVDPIVYDINFKDTANILSPMIRLKTKDPIQKNYAYLPEFGRYYFITSISVQGGITSIALECDVLESFKEDILNSYGLVTRYKGGNKFFDGGYNSEVRKQVSTYYSENTPDYKNEIILVTIK